MLVTLSIKHISASGVGFGNKRTETLSQTHHLQTKPAYGRLFIRKKMRKGMFRNIEVLIEVAK